MDEELKQHLEGMEARIVGRLTERVESRIDAAEERMKNHVSEECHAIETKLLAEFWKWGRATDQKMRRVEFSDATTVERMTNLEERVFMLERKAFGSKD
jgi:hypothetical protein